MERALKLLTIPILLIGIIVTQYFFDTEKTKAKYQEPTVLKPEIIKLADLGLHNAASDIEWLAMIQYFGGNQSKTNEKLSDYLNLATTLDPKFSYPYAFGALILPDINKTDEAISLAEKGIKEAEPDWRIPYYTAVTYFLEKQDMANAAKYFDLAAHTPGAPANIQTIAANFGSRSDKREQTKQIWLGIAENSNDEIVQNRAKMYVEHYEILDFLDEVIGKYQQKYSKAPSTIDDLITDKILIALPPDPFGLQFKIDEKGKAAVK